jgi:hypothetical protein
VLDHDQQGDFDRLVALWSGCSGVVYTTKSHGEQGERYRVAVALKRPVTTEEYAKVWQWAAARSSAAGCPPDQQCKDASRFWYSPTMPPGGWRAERLRGAPVDPGPIIALRQQPPLRVVRPSAAPDTSDRMRRARAYLAKIPGAISGSHGHTATFNAVASVLIGFDLSEADALELIASDYNPRCDPPWSERELEHKIRSVAAQCQRERGYLLIDRPRVDSTRSAASYAPDAPTDLSVDWTTLLLSTTEGKTRRAYHNTAVFVRHHPRYRGKWSMDMMTETPWFDGCEMNQTMIHQIRAYADCTLGYTPPASDVEAAVIAAAHDRPFHPIRQYLRSIDWDGTPRLHAMARDYLGSESPLHAEMVRKFMIGAAMRALHPGCKLDTALMLVGPQGYRKSTFFKILGGQWHADSFLDITSKDGTMQLHAAWIYELAELENVVTGARESRLKAWMASDSDLYRPPYAKVTRPKTRAVALCGTTNRDRILTDETGSRRFWIVPITAEIPFGLLSEMRDQLWAEAVCAAEAGEPWWLDRDLDGAREESNKNFAEDDSWEESIAVYLADPRTTHTTIGHVLEYALKLEPGRHGRAEQMRAARALVHLGWNRKQIMSQGVRKWYYFRPGASLTLL